MRKLSKILAIVLVFTMLLPAGVFANDGESEVKYDYILDCDFSDYDGSDDPPVSSLTGETYFSLEETDPYYNYCLAINTTKNCAFEYKLKGDALTDGAYMLSFDVEKTKTGGLTYIRMYNSAYYETGGTANMFETLAIKNGAITFYKNTKGWSLASDSMEHEASKWYNIRIIIDFNGKKAYYYVDNELLGSSATATAFTELTGFSFRTESADPEQVTKFDNIKLLKLDYKTVLNLSNEGVVLPEATKEILLTEIKSAHTGHIFTSPDVELNVNFRSKIEEQMECSIKYEVLSSRGYVVWSDEETKDFKPGGQYTATVKPQLTACDIYTLRVSHAPLGGTDYSKYERQFSIVNTPSPTYKNDRYGVTSHITKGGRTDAALGTEVYNNLGMAYLRENFSWNSFETQKGVYARAYPEKQDIIMSWVKNYNGRLLVCVGPTNNAHGATSQVPRTPEQLEAFEEAVYRLATTFKEIEGSVDFEMGNELNGVSYDVMSYEAYAKAMTAFYNGVKRAIPDAKVVAGATSRNDHGWLEQILLAGAKCDAISIHPYQGSGTPETTMWAKTLANTREMLKNIGMEHIEIWSTEANTTSSTQWNTELQQGFNLVRHFANVEAYNCLDKFLFYQIQTNDVGKESETEPFFGIIRGWAVENAYGAKPAYVMNTNYFAQTENAVYEDIMDTDGEYILKYKRPDGANVFMMYADRTNRAVSLDLGSDSGILYDCYGTKVADLKSISGKYTFILNDTPYYFVTNATRFEKCQGEIEVPDALVELTKDSTGYFELETTKEFEYTITTHEDCIEAAAEKSGNNISVSAKVLQIPEKYDFEARRHNYGTHEKRDYVTVELTSNGNTYAYLPLAVNYVEWSVDGIMSFRPYSDTNKERWKGVVEITNNTDKPISGTLALESPEEIVKNIKPVRVENLNPGESYTMNFNIPPALITSNHVYKASFTSDAEEKIDIYMRDIPRSFHYKSPSGSARPRILQKANEETVVDGVINEAEWKDYKLANFDKSKVTYGGTTIVLDGLGDKDGDVEVDTTTQVKNDFAGDIYAKWDSEYLYYAYVISDDEHRQNRAPVRFFNEDCISIYCDHSSTQRHDTRLDMALSSLYNEAVMYTNWTPMYENFYNGVHTLAGNSEEYGPQVKIVRNGVQTIYEGRIPWQNLYDGESKTVEKYTNAYLTFMVTDYDLGRGTKTYSTAGYFCLSDFK